jgi:hypothetical protein
MKRSLACIIAIAGWYLLYPPVNHNGSPDSQASLSKWEIDSSYGMVVDCTSAHRSDLSAMRGGNGNPGNSEDAENAFLQTRAGRCVRSDDPRLATESEAAHPGP